MKSNVPLLAILAFCVAVTVAQAQTLATALDNSNLVWTSSASSGSQSWQGQTSVTHDGVDAAKSGPVVQFAGTPGTSTLQTTVTGPGTMTFWWKVHCSLSDFGITCKVGGTTVASTNGMVDWEQKTIYVGNGSQLIQWVYTGINFAGYSNAAWMDQVVFVPGATAPGVVVSPAGQSQVQGLNATFTANYTGTPPFTNQWLCNGTNIPGATTTNYTITNVQPDRVGSYSVAVTNEAGGTVSGEVPLVLGRIAAWGLSSPVPANLTNAQAVAAGNVHGVALRPDSTVTAWGYNAFHQTEVPGDLTNVVAVAAGGHSSMALKIDGTVLAWGLNTMPNGTVTGQTNVPADLTSVIAIRAGAAHAIALRADGMAVAWGYNANGQTNVPTGFLNVVAVAAGGNHTLALQADGLVIAWGLNTSGQTNVPAGLANVVAVAAGDSHNLALKADGSVVAWGNNSAGQTNVPVGLSNVVAVSAGALHSLVLMADGTATAWGKYTDGYGFKPMTVPSNLVNVVAISAHAYQCLALVGDGPPVLYGLPVKPVWANNVFSVSLVSQNNRVYRLEHKDNLSDSAWVAHPLVAGTGGTLTFTDPAATATQRFYRIRRW